MTLPLRTATVILMLVVPVIIPGCGARSGTAPADAAGNASATQISLPTIPAPDYLKQVLSRYRNAPSYRDFAEVRLRVEKEGRLTRRTAPMHVQMDGANLWIAAYDARLWSDPEKTVGWIADEQSDFHDSQVVVGGPSRSDSRSGRPELNHLLGDPLLTARLVSGLGGPPPQLEWLLDPDPMSKLFSGGETQAGAIDYEKIAQRDDVMCVVIHAVAGNDSYRFWIDPLRSLIHCVELPVSIAGKQVEWEGWKIHSLELMLVGASFASPSKPFQMSEMPMSDFPPHPKYVRSLIPLPPQRPDRRLGQLIPDFVAVDASGRLQVTARGADRDFTLWFLGHPQSDNDADLKNLQSIHALTTWLHHSQVSIRSLIRPILLIDQGSNKRLDPPDVTGAPWAVLVQRDAIRPDRFAGVPGQAMLIDSKARMIWVGDPFSSADLLSLTGVIADAASGVDVPIEMLKRWQSDRDAYSQKLTELAAP